MLDYNHALEQHADSSVGDSAVVWWNDANDTMCTAVHALSPSHLMSQVIYSLLSLDC